MKFSHFIQSSWFLLSTHSCTNHSSPLPTLYIIKVTSLFVAGKMCETQIHIYQEKSLVRERVVKNTIHRIIIAENKWKSFFHHKDKQRNTKTTVQTNRLSKITATSISSLEAATKSVLHYHKRTIDSWRDYNILCFFLLFCFLFFIIKISSFQKVRNNMLKLTDSQNTELINEEIWMHWQSFWLMSQNSLNFTEHFSMFSETGMTCK